jgi:mono/diheme cytochrome c family protein
MNAKDLRVHRVPILLGAALLTFLAAGLSTHAQTVASTTMTRVPAVTFTKDIAPIFLRSCAGCHRAGQMAPMSLLTWEEARPWARSIANRVSRREMPPWHLDKTVGVKEYVNDISLSDEEISKVIAWVDGGAPQGDPALMPPLPKFDSAKYEWRLGEPDLVLTTAEDYVVKAKGPDTFIYFDAVPTGLTEDRYIRAIDMRGSLEGSKTVHHANAVAVQDDVAGYNGRVDASMRPGAARWEGTYLMNFNPGMSPNQLPADTGQLLKAGSLVAMDAHYHPYGEEVRDRLSVGIYFYPKGFVPKHRLVTAIVSPKGTRGAGGTSLDIPAGAPAVRHDGYHVLEQAARIVAFQPHMHYRGKAMSLEAILPDGTTQILTSVNRYDFNWQISYIYKNQPVLPKGAILHTIAYHDNSAANRHNPDPTAWIGNGQRTVDEMANGWTDFIYISDDEYRQLTSSSNAQNNSR